MRPVQEFGTPGPADPAQRKLDWCVQMIVRLCEASRDEGSTLAQAFTQTNLTPTRDLDPTTATTADVANVLGTLLRDMRRGGKNRVG